VLVHAAFPSTALEGGNGALLGEAGGRLNSITGAEAQVAPAVAGGAPHPTRSSAASGPFREIKLRLSETRAIRSARCKQAGGTQLRWPFT
jgi:hypothetical protein